MTASDIENIERATIAAVSPDGLEELDGWLLPFDGGTVGRAKSAVPLAHTAANPTTVDRIEARYRAERPTLVQVGLAGAMRQMCAQMPAETASSPDEAWKVLFLGEGFDPVDGAHRVRLLSRAQNSVYASVRENEKTVAAGAAAFSYGWASVHGMRTDSACRGRGLAGRVLAGLADAAIGRGLDRTFLQVESGNTAALALYRRAGFETAWCYEYWHRAR